LSTLTEIKIPDIGDVTEAEIIEVSVTVGDVVEVEDTLIVLETDKATMDVPSPIAGTVKQILCSTGDKAAENSLILIIEAQSEAQSEVQAKAAEPEANAEPEATTSTKTDNTPTTEIEPPAVTTAAVATQQSGALVKQEVTVPDIGDNEAVEVIEISAHPGDVVEVEDPLIVLETEKATMEIPSPIAGTVIGINVVVGDKVSFGDLIASIETGSEKSIEVTEPVAEEVTTIADKTEPSVAQSATIKSTADDYPAINTATRTGLVYASPAVRRFARELGADLTRLKGTGSKGRIVKEDVQKFVKTELNKPTATTSNSAVSELPVIDFSKYGETEAVSLSKIQKVSSKNLQRNWRTIPHVTQNDNADITEMENFRRSMKAEAAADGVKLTPLAFMMKAVVASLKAYPRFNSSLAVDGETLIMKKYFHIGVAVDTPDGLVVPVVKDVDKKSVYQLATELAEISGKAREKKLGIDAMQGSCFSISSLGGIGGTGFTPIVNWPDVAILGVSKSSMQPVWDGQEFKPRLMLPLSLSYDHRVIDGALAARFITHLSKTLGDIRRLVL